MRSVVGEHGRPRERGESEQRRQQHERLGTKRPQIEDHVRYEQQAGQREGAGGRVEQPPDRQPPRGGRA
jgi:hypothetical protein